MRNAQVRSVRRGTIAVVAAAAAVVVGTVRVYAVAQDAADDQQPSLVEDFAYPGADKILAERGIKLLKGGGHILLAECVTNATGQDEGATTRKETIKKNAWTPVNSGDGGTLLELKAWT